MKETAKRKDSKNKKEFKLYSNDSFKQKNPFLITQKSFLEIILKQIKTNQSNFLFDNDNNIKKTKKYLFEFRSFLSSILEEKLKYKKYLEKENLSKKEYIHKLKFSKINVYNIIDKNNNYNCIDNINYNKKNNVEKLINDNINYIKEKKQLEDLCFKAENEIKKIESKILKNIALIIELRTSSILEEKELEISDETPKNILKAGNILKINLKKYKKNLLKLIEKRAQNNIKIKNITEEIEYYKEIIKRKEEYILSDNIILEESSDYSRSIIVDNNINRYNSMININNSKEINQIKIFDINLNIKNNIRKKKEYQRRSFNLFCKDNDNGKMNINNIGVNRAEQNFNKKIIRSLSNKIKKIDFKNFKDNFKLNVNFNFNINNINIINEKSKEDKNNNKENLNLTYENNSLL